MLKKNKNVFAQFTKEKLHKKNDKIPMYVLCSLVDTKTLMTGTKIYLFFHISCFFIFFLVLTNHFRISFKFVYD